MPPPRVALATCRPLPEPDPDEAVTLAALDAAGVDASLVVWNESGAEPEAFDAVVLRSTWDYHVDPEAFLRWTERVSRSTRLVNPHEVVRWNAHKSYLADLERIGIAVVPTAFVERGGTTTLSDLCGGLGWDAVVVKPAVSTSSWRTRRFDRGDVTEGGAFLAELVGERDAMVQPVVPGFDAPGERSLVWIDGEVTHAVRKEPRYEGGGERVSEALATTDEERALVERALSVVPGGPDALLYARLDVVELGDGRSAVSELELIEPSLFLLQSPDAAARFGRAVRRL